MQTSPSIAIYKAPRKRRRRKKSKCNIKPCLFLIPVMFGTMLLLHFARNSLHVSNKLLLKSFLFKIREQFSQQSSYYLLPGEDNFDDVEQYFLDEDDEELDDDDVSNEEEEQDDATDSTKGGSKSISSKRQKGKRGNTYPDTKEDELAYNELDSSIENNKEEEPESRESALQKLMGFVSKGWEAERANLVNTHNQRLELSKNYGIIAVMFTTVFASADSLRTLAQENTLRALAQLQPDIHTIVFTRDERWIKFAKRLGIEVETNVKSNRYGTPLLGPMYQRAYQKKAYFYGYTNGDILFGENLITSLHVVKQMISENKIGAKVLITGRRLEHRLQLSTYITSSCHIFIS
jgi:hypothetical protein